MTAAEDAILLEKITTLSDEQALKQLFEKYYPRLARFAFSLLHNQPVAEEIAEDIFMKLWEKRATLPVIGSLPAYLFTAAHHRVLNHQRLVRNKNWIDFEDAEITLVASSDDPEQNLISAQEIAKIDAAISTLPPQCRLIFQLIKEDGLKYRETAKLLHLSVKTVEAQMGLALRKISEALLQAGTPIAAINRRKK